MSYLVFENGKCTPTRKYFNMTSFLACTCFKAKQVVFFPQEHAYMAYSHHNGSLFHLK